MDDLNAVLTVVEDVLQHIRRKRRLTPDEWEDFHGWVWERLVESDYALIRKHDRRGSMRAFLAVALNRYLLDFRVQKWGKWRPSAKALKLGPIAVDLEFLLQRERHELSDAIQTLIVDRQCGLDEDELRDIASQLPNRDRSWVGGDDWIEQIPCQRPTPEGQLRRDEVDEARARLELAMKRAVSGLTEEERVALKMCYEQQSKLNEIARALGHDERRFYRWFERLLKKVERRLKGDGVDEAALQIVFPDTRWKPRGGEIH